MLSRFSGSFTHNDQRSNSVLLLLLYRQVAVPLTKNSKGFDTFREYKTTTTTTTTFYSRISVTETLMYLLGRVHINSGITRRKSDE